VPENAAGVVTMIANGECASSTPFCLAPVDRMLHDDRWEYLGDEGSPALRP
jgi:hypothetical protein